jgi:cytoskeletal protein CcmA (bactofilin family)
MKPGEGSTVIGRSATFRGDLSSTEDLQIDGTFEGTIHLSSGRLTVGLGARIKASIAAPEVVVFGRVDGDIRATGRVDLRSTAVVLGDVFAARLSIEENAALHGQVDPTRATEVVPVEAKIAALVPATAATAPLLSVPRTPDLFNMQTGLPLNQTRQMPSALAAIAAASRQEPGSQSVPRDEDTSHHE